VTQLGVAEFVSDYLERNQPVIVMEAMRDWRALTHWNPDNFTREFGSESVQIYGDLFKLTRIDSLSNYLTKYFGRTDEPGKDSGAKSVSYVRWYCHLSADERVPWADDIFARLSADWHRPSFFPESSFALPNCDPNDRIDPSHDWFPAKGLFISARGARTRLHADPWCSDAILCQIFGRKDFVMYHPSQTPQLTDGNRTVDIESPDLQAFPQFPHATVAFRDTLEPGEILLVPAGWHHHFTSATDSISLTWNFVHSSRLESFLAYLQRGPQESELKQLAYAYFESPGRHPLDQTNSIASLIAGRSTQTPT
jgi:hypothetical protein